MSQLHIFCKFLETYLLFPSILTLVPKLIFLNLLVCVILFKNIYNELYHSNRKNHMFAYISILAFNCKVPLQVKHYLHLDPVGAKFRHYPQLIKTHWEW